MVGKPSRQETEQHQSLERSLSVWIAEAQRGGALTLHHDRLIDSRRPVIGVPPAVGYWAGRAVGALQGDVTITREEIAGLMVNLLCVETPPTGETKLTDWIAAHADTLGRRYTSELARRVDRAAAYQSN